MILGNPTVDLLDGGGDRPGGSVVYSAAVVARHERRAVVIGAADRALADRLADELPGVQLRLREAERSTVFVNRTGADGVRSQWLLADAGPAPDPCGDPAVLVVGAIYREVRPSALEAPAGFRGLIAQGLLRQAAADGRVHPYDLEPEWTAVAPGCDAVVVSVHEHAQARAFLHDVAAAGGVVVVTRGSDGCTAWADGAWWELPAVPVEEVDETGAGDVFGCTLFLALADGHGLEQALGLAAAAAAHTVAAPGARGVVGPGVVAATVRAHADRLRLVRSGPPAGW